METLSSTPDLNYTDRLGKQKQKKGLRHVSSLKKCTSTCISSQRLSLQVDAEPNIHTKSTLSPASLLSPLPLRWGTGPGNEVRAIGITQPGECQPTYGTCVQSCVDFVELQGIF